VQGALDRTTSLANQRGRALAATVSGVPAGGPGGGTNEANRALGREMAADRGWTGAEFAALDRLWQGESGWSNTARNPSSGAFGIPQALPASKMGAAGAGGNPRAQIAWGLAYIAQRYGDPANAYRTWLGRSPHWYARGGYAMGGQTVVPPPDAAGVSYRAGSLVPGFGSLPWRRAQYEYLMRRVRRGDRAVRRWEAAMRHQFGRHWNQPNWLYGPDGHPNPRHAPARQGPSVPDFAKGGKAGKLPGGFASTAGKLVGKAVTGSGTKLSIKSLAAMQTDRNDLFNAYMAKVDDSRTSYERLDARYNLTDEGDLIDQTTGEPNVKAINQKLLELANLESIREFIEQQLRQARLIAQRVVKTYTTIINSLTKSLRHAKGKDRSGIRSKIKTYQGRRTEWQGKLKDLGGDIFQAHTDVLEIQGERSDVQAALGGSADIRTQYAQSLADAASQGAGGDTTAPDTTTAAPTAADIAAGVIQQLQTFQQGRTDLLSAFAPNFVSQRQAYMPGGAFSGSPDALTAAGGVRFFGGAGGGGLGGLAGASVTAHFASAPPDPPSFVQQVRFLVENGSAG
jgi:hypothetical protein